jgi:hypothetical protein
MFVLVCVCVRVYVCRYVYMAIHALMLCAQHWWYISDAASFTFYIRASCRCDCACPRTCVFLYYTNKGQSSLLKNNTYEKAQIRSKNPITIHTQIFFRLQMHLYTWIYIRIHTGVMPESLFWLAMIPCASGLPCSRRAPRFCPTFRTASETFSTIFVCVI